MANPFEGTVVGPDGKRYPAGSVPDIDLDDIIGGKFRIYGTPGNGKIVKFISGKAHWVNPEAAGTPIASAIPAVGDYDNVQDWLNALMQWIQDLQNSLDQLQEDVEEGGSAVAANDYRSKVLEDNPVALWTLDGTLADAMGNYHDATGSASDVDYKAPLDNSSTQSAVVPFGLPIQNTGAFNLSGGFTVEALVEVPAAPQQGGMKIIGSMSQGDDAQGKWSVGIDGTQVKFYAGVGGGAVAIGSALSVGVHHVAIVVGASGNNPNIKVYVDGVQTVSQNTGIGGTTTWSAANLALGALDYIASGFSSPYYRVDEIAFYQGQLSAERIGVHNTARVAVAGGSVTPPVGSLTGRVARWPFDEPGDSSGSGRPLDVVGGSMVLNAAGSRVKGLAPKSWYAKGGNGINPQLNGSGMPNLAGLTNLSMEVWARWTALPSSGQRNTVLGFAVPGTGGKQLYMLDDGSLVLSHDFTATTPKFAGVTLAINTTYHIVLTRTAPQTYNLYLNGVLSGTITTADSFGQAVWSADTNLYFPSGNVSVDECCIYNRVLSLAEIQSRTTNGLAA